MVDEGALERCYVVVENRSGCLNSFCLWPPPQISFERNLFFVKNAEFRELMNFRSVTLTILSVRTSVVWSKEQHQNFRKIPVR